MSWQRITCDERESVFQSERLIVLSSLTDLDGEFGEPSIFTEWGREDDTPVLRDQRWPSRDIGAPDRKPCAHYIPSPETGVSQRSKVDWGLPIGHAPCRYILLATGAHRDRGNGIRDDDHRPGRGRPLHTWRVDRLRRGGMSVRGMVGSGRSARRTHGLTPGTPRTGCGDARGDAAFRLDEGCAVSRRGTNYNERMRQAARASATDALLARAAQSLAGAATAAHAEPCPCGHPWDEHDGDEGCLHGWGEPGMITGCFCERA